LSDNELVEIVNITTVECYVNHIVPSAELSDIEIDDMRLIIGQVCMLYKELVAERLYAAETGSTPETLDRITTIKNAIKTIWICFQILSFYKLTIFRVERTLSLKY
jgi:hypothetical protein